MAARGRSSFVWLAGFAGASLLNLLSLAGLADSVVEWRCFLNIEQLVASYLAFKAFVFQLVPIRVPEVLKDYLIITASFSVMLEVYSRLAEKKSISRMLRTNDRHRVFFTIALFVVPWLVLVGLAVLQVRWRMSYKRARNILSADSSEQRRLEALKVREDEKAKILSLTVAGYPLACVALLFVFSDFAYTLTGQGEIAGVAFAYECPANGDVIRISQ
ncbi:MAG: hypothetical protein ACK4X1_04645 [Terricaulis sp.]